MTKYSKEVTLIIKLLIMALLYDSSYLQINHASEISEPENCLAIDLPL